MYYSQISCTFSFDFWSIWISLDSWSETTFFLLRSSELQDRGIWWCSTELLVFRILWHLLFRVCKSWMLETFIRTSVFRNFKHLIRSIIFRGWDLFIRTFCPKSSEASWQIFRTCWRWWSSEQKQVFRSALDNLWLAHATSDGTTSASESESV